MMARRKSPGRRLYEFGESLSPVFWVLLGVAILGRLITWLIEVIRGG